MSMKLYDVEGYDHPLELTEELAAQVGGVEHGAATMPRATASKADWVDWAVTQGEDRGVAEALTKAELVAGYGSE
jgi:hypothetical protein